MHKGVTPRDSMAWVKINTCYDKYESTIKTIVPAKWPTTYNCKVKVAYSYSSEIHVKEKGKLISLIWFYAFDKSSFV